MENLQKEMQDILVNTFMFHISVENSAIIDQVTIAGNKNKQEKKER